MHFKIPKVFSLILMIYRVTTLYINQTLLSLFAFVLCMCVRESLLSGKESNEYLRWWKSWWIILQKSSFFIIVKYFLPRLSCISLTLIFYYYYYIILSTISLGDFFFLLFKNLFSTLLSTIIRWDPLTFLKRRLTSSLLLFFILFLLLSFIIHFNVYIYMY